jgi:hypothetical protein
MYGTTFDMDVDFVGIVQTCNCANQQVSAHNIWETTWPDNIALPLHSQSSSGTTQSVLSESSFLTAYLKAVL